MKTKLLKINPFLIACVTLPGLFPASGLAEVIENVHTEHYTIAPRTPYDIKRELNWRSPIRENGHVFHGRTHWIISWQYTSQQKPEGCRILDVTTEVEVKYILPALDTRVSDPNTTERFNRFSEALVAHERNHGANGLKAAREIDASILALPPQTDCRQLENTANATGQAIISKYAAIDNEYDRRTMNGRTEGAFIR